MAAPIYGQWICHSPNVMKTDIFADNGWAESSKSTRGSIRFDSLTGQRDRVIYREPNAIISLVDAIRHLK
jgi:hypothetical protein